MDKNTLVEMIDRYKKLVEFVKADDDTTPTRIDIDAVMATLTDDEKNIFSKFDKVATQLDAMIHKGKNFNTKLAILFNERVKTIARDSKIVTQYLQEVDKFTVKVQLDSERVDAIKEARDLRKKIDKLHDVLKEFNDGNNVLAPEMYKEKNTRGGKTLALDIPMSPSLPGDDDDDEKKSRGRVSINKQLVLGTIENGEVVWHDEDHIGTVFVRLYGSVRSDANHYQLFKACEKKFGEDWTRSKGWDTPVEFAGRLWVAKVRDTDEDDSDSDEDNDE